MEDRETPGLYLELSDAAPEEYVSTRVDAVLARPAVTRATWWRNCKPDRRDLRRRLPEFTTLGVYELDGTRFDAPAAPRGTRGIHFVRTPRPGQGNLSGLPTLGLSLVLISPRDPARGQELRDWADFVHIRYIAAMGVPGFTMITPYEHVDGAGAEPRYLHFYEMDTADAEPAFKRMTPIVSLRYGVPGSPVFDEWAMHPQLVIEYVSSFTRLGERWA